MDHQDKWVLSKQLLDKLADKPAMIHMLREGRSAQNLWEFSDQMMEKLYLAAHQLLENKKNEEAVNAFVFLVTMNPIHSEYWLGLGASLQRCHEYEAAIDAYEITAIYSLGHPLPYIYLAKCLFAIHDRTSALQALELAIEYTEGHEEFAELKKEALHAKEMLLHLTSPSP
jgi:type III secretion system low calcium response chaperone LcrH/SycD